MSKEKKMITSEEFDLAVQLIADYKLQLDNQLKKVSARNQKINIQGDIRENTFRILQKYYQMYYAITLQWDDLKAMDRYLLETIDYEKIKFLKGSERMSLQLLKKLMVSHSINCQ
ncbi:hypothetical protein C3L50_11085 [Flavobacterium alvei]|uniref:Uncharacterized protein n=2 Tax=Flavobacterium alvei TaxID=2080416 RepID=A0A2S5A7U9_9FLAO|nr:hypothetical protein C3L50_11085 [Flavobacterium alvei]